MMANWKIESFEDPRDHPPPPSSGPTVVHVQRQQQFIAGSGYSSTF